MTDDRLQGQFCAKLKPGSSNIECLLASNASNRGLSTAIYKQRSLPIPPSFEDPHWWMTTAYLNAKCYVVAQQLVLVGLPITKC